MFPQLFLAEFTPILLLTAIILDKIDFQTAAPHIIIISMKANRNGSTIMTLHCTDQHNYTLAQESERKKTHTMINQIFRQFQNIRTHKSRFSALQKHASSAFLHEPSLRLNASNGIHIHVMMVWVDVFGQIAKFGKVALPGTDGCAVAVDAEVFVCGLADCVCVVVGEAPSVGAWVSHSDACWIDFCE